MDWRHPGGPSIGLAVIRHLASRPGQRIGSLFLNPGGPGDSGVAAVTGRGEALDATLLKFAVLPTPAIWPQAAALLEQAAEGDASATGRYLVDLTTPARGTVCPSDRLPFDPDFGARRSS